jgi:hypothetical protein
MTSRSNKTRADSVGLRKFSFGSRQSRRDLYFMRDSPRLILRRKHAKRQLEETVYGRTEGLI